MDFILTPATDSDLPYLLMLRKLTMSEHLQRAGRNLDDQQHMQRVKQDFDCAKIVSYRNCRIGMIKFRQSQHEMEIMQLQIHPDFQGRGLGQKLLEQIFTQATVVSLSVLRGNPAIRLYEKLGFSVIGEDEDEFFMRRDT